MPVTQLKDPCVTPRTIFESWGDFRKELMNEIRLMQGRDGLTTVMKAPLFSKGHQLFRYRTSCLSTRNRCTDPLMPNQRADQIGQHAVSVLRRPT